MRRRLRMSRKSTLLTVRDQLEQRAVRVAEVHAGASAAPARAGRRAELDLNAAGEEMRDRFLRRAVPAEAEVAVAGLDRIGRARHRARARAVDVQLLAVRQAVGVAAPGDLLHLDPEHVRVEAIGALVVGDCYDDVVDPRGQGTET